MSLPNLFSFVKDDEQFIAENPTLLPRIRDELSQEIEANKRRMRERISLALESLQS
jgi:hypothetical protein